VNGHHVSLYAPINGILNVYNNNLELHPDMSNLRDNGQALRVQVELNTIIQQFKQVRREGFCEGREQFNLIYYNRTRFL
jgi:DNA-binding transcriptional MocR family regulator